VRFSVAEYELLQSKFQSTTSRQLSDYIRRILLNKKVTVFTRNKSLDEFMAEMILLRKEMNAVGNNFNQSIKKLNALQHFPEVKLWLSVYDSSREIVMRKVEEIKSKINQFSDSMVARIVKASSLSRSLNYNEQKVQQKCAELIHAENYPKDLEHLSFHDRLHRLKHQASLNRKSDGEQRAYLFKF
jgi:hypothetical protein